MATSSESSNATGPASSGQPTKPTSAQEASGPPETDRTIPRRRDLTPARATLLAGYVAAGAAVLAAVIGAIATYASNDEPSASSVTAAPKPPGLAAPSSGWRVRVINTDGPGVFKFEQPTNRSGKRYGPGEGELVDVQCQVRDGQPLSDPTPAPGQPSNWPVWNKLSDGLFIPDLYTDLPKDPGPTPPNGIPVC